MALDWYQLANEIAAAREDPQALDRARARILEGTRFLSDDLTQFVARWPSDRTESPIVLAAVARTVAALAYPVDVRAVVEKLCETLTDLAGELDGTRTGSISSLFGDDVRVELAMCARDLLLASRVIALARPPAVLASGLADLANGLLLRTLRLLSANLRQRPMSDAKTVAQSNFLGVFGRYRDAAKDLNRLTGRVLFTHLDSPLAY